MATCLVTGGSGFLGSHLCDALLARGQRVICVDNFDTGSLDNIAHLRGPQFHFLHQDITEPFYVEESVDFVYHFASPASPIDYLRLPLHTLKVGSYGTHHALGLAKLHRARFLTASTSEVYGDPQVHPQPEYYWGHVNPIGPRGVYDEAKRYAEALTMAYHRQQGVDTAIIRIFNTYGPRMRPNDGRAIPTFLRQALSEKPITRSVFGHKWRAAVKGARLPAGTGFQALRHYYASLLIRHGESVKTVQSRLGHASAVETLDTYSHLWPDSDDRTRDAIDSVLGFTADALRTEAPAIS